MCVNGLQLMADDTPGNANPLDAFVLARRMCIVVIYHRAHLVGHHIPPLQQFGPWRMRVMVGVEQLFRSNGHEAKQHQTGRHQVVALTPLLLNVLLARDLQFTKHFQQGVLQLLTDFGLSSCGHRHSWFVLWVWSNMYVFQF